MLKMQVMARSFASPHPAAALPGVSRTPKASPAPARKLNGNNLMPGGMGPVRARSTFPPTAKILPPNVLALQQKATVPAAALVLLLGIYIAMHTSLAGEILAIFLHIPLPVVGVFSLIVPAAVAFVGRPTQFFGAPVAKPWILLNIWMALAALFSFYPHDSVSSVIPLILRLQIMPVLFCGVATTSKSTRSLLKWAALGLLPLLLLCFTSGQMLEGYRFAIPETSLANPNDLAFHLLWGCMLLLVFLFGRNKLMKIMVLMAVPTSLWFILKTASRSNFLTIFAVVAMGLLLTKSSTRVMLLLGIPLALAIMLPLLPRDTLDRITAIASGSSAGDAAEAAKASGNDKLEGAFDSEAARLELSRLAVDATLRHPVFGVGMQMFGDETADHLMKTKGTKGPWQSAHDSYLKISSENGIPALIFYVWAILSSVWMTWSTLRKTRARPGFEDAYHNSICILMALVAYVVGTFFCDIVYLPYFSVTIGLAAANYMAFRNEDRLAAALAQLEPSFGVK
jgi:hypothetical protein